MSTVVDLRSDTVTRPTAAMRRAMADAEVGDDVYGEDPTVLALQEHVAGMFGREAALFVTSGLQANLVAMHVWGRPATDVIVEAGAHLTTYEGGASTIFAGVQWRQVAGDRGRLSADLVRTAAAAGRYPFPRVSCVSVEQTTNLGGGAYLDLAALQAVRAATDELEANLYMDGARVFNAIVADGVRPADYGALVDGLGFCVSKGLGAPVGSLLVGDGDAMAEARQWRHRHGGAMRQVGVLAAAARHALDHHVDRLAEDHEHARLVAKHLAEAVPGCVDPSEVVTNIVYVDTGDVPAPQVAGAAAEAGVRISAFGPTTLRLVTHLDVDADGCLRAADVIARALLAGS